MIFPRDILIGHDTLSRIAQMCSDFNFRNVGMIITGCQTYRSAGKFVEECMIDSGFEISVHHTGNASMMNVEKAVDEAKERKSNFLLAVGGGNKIDVAKLAAKELKIPFVSIPTSAAHDGIASGMASIKSSTISESVEAATPIGIIADTNVISKAPYRFLASGCADVISNKSALADWKFAKSFKNVPFSTSAFALSELSANTIIENSKNIKPGVEESTWIALKSIIISGISMSVAGSSRPTSGSEHIFSHALDVMHPGTATHGEQCGVGCIMMTYLQGGDWISIRNALKNIGAPVNAQQLNLSTDDILDAFIETPKIRRDRITILGERGIDRKTARMVAETTMVI
ncbi:MAG: NAD(P)-dependent glycerol-1-phosphate dehydrogenase [archaeon]|nr:NAD(P)-dependent glycerol-1-phosphate dehydrogenase [archaeon]